MPVPPGCHTTRQVSLALGRTAPSPCGLGAREYLPEMVSHCVCSTFDEDENRP